MKNWPKKQKKVAVLSIKTRALTLADCENYQKILKPDTEDGNNQLKIRTEWQDIKIYVVWGKYTERQCISSGKILQYL